MILETIITTLNVDGTLNVSPMGPTVNLEADGTPSLDLFELRPFNTSKTFANLKRTKAGVLHITDNVELFARAAIGEFKVVPEAYQCLMIEGKVLRDACRSYEFQVEYIDETGPRMNLNCRTVQVHRNRDFFGFNRAKHAVLEAAIIATRLDFLPAAEVADQFTRFNTIVGKTGALNEQRAMDLLNQFVQDEGNARA